MYITNIVIGLICMGYGTYRISTEASAAGFILLVLGLANFVMGVSMKCK